MFNARVYDLFIASPSDVSEERIIIENVIHEWNVINSRSKKYYITTSKMGEQCIF